MSFFSQEELTEIRSDPSSIDDLYDAAGARFADALGMAGLSVDAYKSAFCTVLAYDLVPYGNETPTLDVRELANAPSLACDLYVTLAWSLADLLGVSGDFGTAVGWDGGAVGNHAQLLFDDGQSQLLLDPTIGLIVNGATFDGLINGVHYSDMQSFFWRSDIPSFDTTVIDAVQDGSYQIWDTIYSVPGLDEWQTNYADHLGLTVDHGDGSQTIIGFIDDDAITAGSGNDFIFGGRGSDTIDGGDGLDHAVYRGDLSSYAITFDGSGNATVASAEGVDTLRHVEVLQFDDQNVAVSFGHFVQSDSSDQFTWSSITTDVDYQNQATRIAYQYDDNSSWIYQYDTLEQFSWNRLQTITDAQGQVTKQLYDQNDGSHVAYTYDLSNTQQWARVTDYLTSDWNSYVTKLYDMDDGTHVMYQNDVNNSSDWYRIESYYSSNWSRTTLVYHEDNGTHIAYQYDVNNSKTWSSLQTNYDANFHRVSEVVNNDDGTHAVLQFNSTDQLVAALNYDAHWTLLA